LKTEIHAVYLACKGPRGPWYAKALMALVIGYALSPIDLNPDFIPVLVQIDDLIIVPAGIAIVLRMIPKDVLDECRERAKSEPIDTKTKWVIAFIIIMIWLLAIYFVLQLIWPIFL